MMSARKNKKRVQNQVRIPVARVFETLQEEADDLEQNKILGLHYGHPPRNLNMWTAIIEGKVHSC